MLGSSLKFTQGWCLLLWQLGALGSLSPALHSQEGVVSETLPTPTVA